MKEFINEKVGREIKLLKFIIACLVKKWRVINKLLALLIVY